MKTIVQGTLDISKYALGKSEVRFRWHVHVSVDLLDSI
jgi:hypothetical protein